MLLCGGLLSYFLIAGICYFSLYIMHKKFWAHLRLSRKAWTTLQIRSEIRASSLSLIIFGVFITTTYIARDLQLTRIYWHVSQRGWLYSLISFIGLFLLHDSYFYFLHRLLHSVPILRKVHQTHHYSSNPSPWAAFSFHPFEAILSAFFFPVMAVAFPVQRFVFVFFIFTMVFTTVLYHCGYDLLSGLFRFRERSWLCFFSWVNSTRVHALHHEFSNKNFGLYFTLWDRIFGTYKPVKMAYSLRYQNEDDIKTQELNREMDAFVSRTV